MILSILTMTENYPEIWINASFPSDITKQDIIDKICIECGELELLYSDPDILKYMIRNWCRTESHVWEKLADTLDLQYNPIYNLDVTYEETRTPNLTKERTPNLTDTRNTSGYETRTPNVTETTTPNTTTTETPTDTTTEAVAGFNAATFENARQTTRGGSISTSHTGTDTVKTTGVENVTDQHNETISRTGKETEKETGTETTIVNRYGNQGVTMTQDMIQKEREISMFNLYDYICKSFKNRFCLLVY